MKVLIVGGGIGGLYLCALLRQRNIDTVLIEKAPEFSTIGYVLGVLPNGLRMFKELGLDNAIKEKGKKLQGMLIHDGNGRRLARASLAQLADQYGPSIEIERDTVHTLLQEANAGADIRMGTTVHKLHDHGDRVTVTFSDGKTEDFDLVVGADGISSQIRPYVSPTAHKDYSGFMMVLAWVPYIADFPKNVSYYLGDGKLFAVFPTKSAEHITVTFMLACPPGSIYAVQDIPAYLKEHFGDMGGDVPRVLEYLDHRKLQVFRNDDNEIHLRQWYKGRIVLIGDAAHATSLLMGEGASMALEDAYVLRQELLGHNTISEALSAYNERRYHRVHELARWSGLSHLLIKKTGPMAGLRNMSMEIVETMILDYYQKLFSEMP